MREQSELLQRQREAFELEKENSKRDLEKIKENLLIKEIEINKRANFALERDGKTKKPSESIDLTHEIGQLNNGETCVPPLSPPHHRMGSRLYDAHASTIYNPHDFLHENSGPRLSFREALETVPHFDGRNIPLSQFIRACRRAKDILPPSSERNLTRLLLTKLRGRAACAVEDEICETITQLADLLNGAFGSPKTIDQYRGELSTIYLKPNEHILDYITRAKDLRSSILDSERRERGLTNNSMAEIDALTARSFCDGLPLSYRLQLTKDLYIDPFAAFSHVKILAKRQELDNERFNPARRNEPIYERNVYSTGRPLAHSTPIKPSIDRSTSRWPTAAPARYPNQDHYRPSGLRSNIPIEGRHTNRNEPQSPNKSRYEPDKVAREQKFCRYCKNPGHQIEECRKRDGEATRDESSGKSNNRGTRERATRIAIVSPADFSHAPTVTLPAEGLLPGAKFMVDTGAAPNLVKQCRIDPKIHINPDSKIILSGITDGQIETLGTIDIEYLGFGIRLHVVNNKFPISQDGILGSEFLRDASCINFSENCVIWQGLRVPFDYDVYLGDAVVTNRDGIAYAGIINSSEKARTIAIPTVELLEVEKFFSEDTNLENNKNNKVFAATAISHTDKREKTQIINNLLRLSHLNEEESSHVSRLIDRHQDLFHLPGSKLGFTSVIKHKIATSDEQPINTKQYRFPPVHKEEIEKQIKELLENDVIKPSESPYNSPLWIVPKKADSKGNKRWRMVIDYRALNEKTIGDAYPLPNITEILDQLGSAKYFSVFDLASGFHQIPMHESHAGKTAFSTPHGHYEFNRMPFGLKNAPATFQRLMDQVLSGLQGNELFVYLDDIVLYASSLKEHEVKFNKLAERLKKANLKLQPDKCEFLRKEVGYLGHIISDQGVKPDPAKIQAVKEFPTPRNAKNIKQFLGLAGYYRRFIPNFSKTARPLTNLLKKEEPFVWKKEQESAFVQLREALCTEPILQYPDFTKPFVVTTDASGHAIGGILSQGPIGKDLPISYTSRLLNAAEKNYSTIEKELLAIVYCVNYFRPYLYGRKFDLVTDHKPLIWLHSVKDPTSRLVRWRLKLAEYEYEVKYKAGKINANADALSRNPIHILPTAAEEGENARVLPIEGKIVSDSEESLFNCTPKPAQVDRQNHSSNSADEAPQTPSDESDESGYTETDSSSSDSDSYIFDNPNETAATKNLTGPRIIEIPDNFATRRDNLVVFITQQGAPIDTGARMLQETQSLPLIRDAALARAKVNKSGSKYIISLVIKERLSEITERIIVKEALRSLLDVVTELGLQSISIAKGNVDNVPWEVIHSLLTRILDKTNLKIFTCSNKITIPPNEDRLRILEENHCSAIGGHKGITKTFNRVKKRYNWAGMKADIQSFIRNCRSCQLKKLVRVKTKTTNGAYRYP
ncbi:hypothetical protein ACFW04_014363 [Cataglyphis niger]